MRQPCIAFQEGDCCTHRLRLDEWCENCLENPDYKADWEKEQEDA